MELEVVVAREDEMLNFELMGDIHSIETPQRIFPAYYFLLSVDGFY